MKVTKRPAVNNANQFSPGNTGFLNLRSANYLRDYNEVKSMGSAAVRSAAPDSPESQAARFWPGGGANVNTVLAPLIADDGGDLWEHARTVSDPNWTSYITTPPYADYLLGGLPLLSPCWGAFRFCLPAGGPSALRMGQDLSRLNSEPQSGNVLPHAKHGRHRDRIRRAGA